ncbi:MAG: hypothetical protein K8H88_01245, partial [Sandaracinaceae bacterium]|nr:hypothetical protein [Sandaracinaceae bacterium]
MFFQAIAARASLPRFGYPRPPNARTARCAIRLGCPKESAERERRVAIAPPSVSKLRALGLEVVIERGAGAAAGYGDEDYERADAVMADRDEVFACEIVAKVRPPTDREIALFREGAVLVSLIYPARNEGLVEVLNERKITVIALDKVPRTTRAQSMDVLSSMANLAGYRAVVEAAAEYQGFFGPQVTAAGTLPPA